MLLANFKLFIRHLYRKKLFSLINIIGLSVGLACVLLLSLYLQDELSIDSQHPAAGQKFRLETILDTGNEVLAIDTSPPMVTQLLLSNFGEIIDSTRFYQGRFTVSRESTGEDALYEDQIGFADPNLGRFFDFTWLEGSPESAWQDLNSVVISRSLAQKYFAGEDAMGATLVLNGTLPLVVTGIIEETDLDSHINLDAIAPMGALPSLMGDGVFDSWFNLGFASYIELAPDTRMEALWPALASLLENNMPVTARQLFDPAYKRLADIHLHTILNPGTERTRMDDVRVLVSISIAILLIAIINFVNLATARSSERHKEIAIRKVTGSGKQQIFIQHMSETMIMVFFALLLALGITELSLPLVNGFTGKQLALLGNLQFWMVVAVVALFVAFLAGAYPALYLSGFRPLEVLRQKQRESSGVISYRNLLVVSQFTIAIVAIIASMVMASQLRFALNRELGFDKDNVLVIQNSTEENWASFKREVQSTDAVQQVSAGMSRPFMSIASSMPVRYEGMETPVENMSGFSVEFDYFELFKVRVLAGRVFSEVVTKDRQPFPTDDNPHPPGSVVLNRAMVERLGWTIDSAVGKRFEMLLGPGPEYTSSIVGEVVGVVDNMYVDSVQRQVVPLYYFVSPSVNSYDYTFLKLADGNQQSRIDQIASVWRDFYPSTPMFSYMLDTRLDQLYQREEKQAVLLGFFALLSVFISCMGLIGLAAYATEKRVKEVGIRKTVGASIMQIVMLFSNEFSRLVLISNVIAWPIAWVAMQRWLENFAYRIDLTPLIFIGSGLIALCVAWVTVGGTAANAASQKPVLALRYE